MKSFVAKVVVALNAPSDESIVPTRISGVISCFYKKHSEYIYIKFFKLPKVSSQLD